MKAFHSISGSRLIILFVLGLGSISSQVVLLREYLMIFGGNELLIGIFLANWLLLTALGAFTGRLITVQDKHISYWTLFYSWSAILLLFLMDRLRNVFFLPGVQISIGQVTLFSALFLLPVCFLSGLLFASVSRELTRSGISRSAEWTYGTESAGSMAGGLLVTFALIYLNDNFRAASLLALAASLPILLASGKQAHWASRAGLSLLVIVVSVLVFAHGSRFSRQFLFSGQHILEIKDTPHGNLTVTGSSGQLNFYSNHVLLFSTDNQLASEEAVHFAMVQHPSPRRILLISGGIAGLTTEILKYPSVEEVDYLEPDPEMLLTGKKFKTGSEDKRVHTISGDPRLFLRRTGKKYDVILVNLPEPSTYQLNRFYSLEFLKEMKNKLADSGYFSFSLPRSANYANEGELKMHSSLYLTCKAVFSKVVIFTNGKSHFVASEGIVKTNIGQLIEDKHITTSYVNSYYIDDRIMQQRMKELLAQLSAETKINSDFRPVAVTGYFSYWLSQFGVRQWPVRILMLTMILFLVVFLLASSPATSGMFAAGFTGSALQVVLLISFQAVYGSVYQSLGLFSATFMAGLALGAFLRVRIFKAPAHGNLTVMLVFMAGISCMVPAVIGLADKMAALPFMVHLLFLAMILAVSVLTGMLFSLSVATGSNPGNKIATMYAADLSGAALGAFLISFLIIPLVGIKAAPWAPGLINLVTVISLIIRKKK